MKVQGVTPAEGYGGALFRVEPPIVLDNGTVALHVITSWGLETILGDENFNVFPADEKGRVLDWYGLCTDGAPQWVYDLAFLDDDA
ncbi:hypothetical protein [Azohydromonas aeria]|uniref:hypothetical protein n=1 Tax=Azohydromonas aeria TaxID=2590212 RepID=UPI0012F7E835|nr:hypothetical protein [Azohydromonas aeria]